MHMQKQLLTLLLFLFITITKSNAQWLTNSNGIHYSAGNVGIGVALPAYKLDVDGSVLRLRNPSTAYANYTSLRVQGGNFPNGLEIDFFGSPLFPELGWTYGAGHGGAAIVNTNPKPLVLGTDNLPRIFITGTGNVGIGTGIDEPIAKLEVRGSMLLESDNQGSLFYTRKRKCRIK